MQAYSHNQPKVCENNNMGWVAILSAQCARGAENLGHVNTKRPTLSSRDSADRYRESVMGKTGLDFKKSAEPENELTYRDRIYESHLKSVQNDPRLKVSDLARFPGTSLVQVTAVGNNDPELRLATLPTIVDANPDRAVFNIRFRNMRYGDPYIYVRRDYWDQYPAEKSDLKLAKANFIALESHGKNWISALDKLLKKHPTAFVFLTAKEHAEWMDWRRSKGLPADFPHVRMSNYERPASVMGPQGMFGGRTFSELSTSEKIVVGAGGVMLAAGGAFTIGYAVGVVSGGGAGLAASVASTAVRSAVGYGGAMGAAVSDAAAVAVGNFVGSTVGSTAVAGAATVMAGITAGVAAGVMQMRHRRPVAQGNPVPNA